MAARAIFCGVQLEVNRTKLKSKTLNSSKFLNLNIYIFRIVLQNNILQNIYYIYNNSLELFGTEDVFMDLLWCPNLYPLHSK